MRNERRVTVYLSEEEYELLVERENESGKPRSQILKESLYREQNIMDAKFSDSIFKIACWIDQKEYDNRSKFCALFCKKICRLSNS